MLKMSCSGPLRSRRPWMSSSETCHSRGLGTEGRSLSAPLLNGLSSIPALARMASVSDLLECSL